jgi:hypothetical protein
MVCCLCRRRHRTCLCSWQRELHFRVESPTPNPQVAKCLTAPGRMSEDAALRPSSYIPPAASGPAEEPMPKPQPNGCQLGMAHWQPGAGLWPLRGQSGQVCAGAQFARGQAASRQPQAPAVPASSRVQVPGALPRSLSALERTRSTAVQKAPSHRAFYVPRPCCLSEALRRRPPEPHFCRREPCRAAVPVGIHGPIGTHERKPDRSAGGWKCSASGCTKSSTPPMPAIATGGAPPPQL